MSTSPRLTLDAVLRQTREYRDVTITAPKPTLCERVRTAIAYASVAAGVGFAVFYVTPVSAQGSMAQDVRVVSVSPSIVQFGTPVEQKLRADITRDNNRAANQMQLEDQRALHQRQLEEDRAYYKKLEWQRKQK